MQTLLLISIILVLVVLLQDKIQIINPYTKKTKKIKQNSKKSPPNIADPKSILGQIKPKKETKSQSHQIEYTTRNLDIEYDENEFVNIPIPQEELTKDFRAVLDLEEEQTWITYDLPSSETGFAQGVTFEELKQIGALLADPPLVPSQRESIPDLVQKIHGTELFHLLEKEMEQGYERLTVLLEHLPPANFQDSPSKLRKKDLQDFNIDDFV